ncbi:MAG: hypothetical protein JXR96_17200 [Deltaproteobacteria bacterium]|nr:hypothetical protein [Deltaproteobacteria bacterium]
MEPRDVTIEVLESIRDEIREMRGDMNERIGETNERLDSTNERLDSTNERLDRLEKRHIEAELRLATEVTEVARTLKDVKDLLVTNLEVRSMVSDHERRIGALEQRIELGEK